MAAKTPRRKAQATQPPQQVQIEAPGPDHEYEVNGHKFKLNGALPLSWGDWVDLENKGISPQLFESEGRVQLTVGQIFVIASHIIKKACPEVTDADMRAIKLHELTVQRVMAQLEAEMLKEAESLSVPS